VTDPSTCSTGRFSGFSSYALLFLVLVALLLFFRGLSGGMVASELPDGLEPGRALNEGAATGEVMDGGILDVACGRFGAGGARMVADSVGTSNS
jgi:hypothetical protein